MLTPLILSYRSILPTISPAAFIAPGAVVIGDVEIGPDSSIWFGCVLRGDVNYIRIGARTNIQDGTIVHVASGLQPARFSTLSRTAGEGGAPSLTSVSDGEGEGEGVVAAQLSPASALSLTEVSDRSSAPSPAMREREKDGYPTLIGDDVTVGHCALLHACTLESNSFVGMRATVMDGCVIEGHAMLAAGALLTPGKRIPKGQLWAGSPAKYLRDLTEADIAQFDLRAEQYAELGREYMKEAGNSR